MLVGEGKDVLLGVDLAETGERGGGVVAAFLFDQHVQLEARQTCHKAGFQNTLEWEKGRESQRHSLLDVVNIAGDSRPHILARQGELGDITHGAMNHKNIHDKQKKLGGKCSEKTGVGPKPLRGRSVIVAIAVILDDNTILTRGCSGSLHYRRDEPEWVGNDTAFASTEVLIPKN